LGSELHISTLDVDIVSQVRERSGVSYSGEGPTDELIVAGVRGFVREFAYWYGRVLEEALPKYRSTIVDRINPMVRGMELDGLPLSEVASRIVGDYARRNFVTAGGWALEQLAIAASPTLQKSAAAGIDAERHQPGPPPVSSLYVIKSGPITRNSDILKQLKQHGAEAQKRLMQTNKKAVVRLVYVVLVGKLNSTFDDGIVRPSSAEFWADAFGLDNESDAINMALAMAQTAGRLLKDGSIKGHVSALERAVGLHIATAKNPDEVDWEFIAQRNMIANQDVQSEDRLRRNRVIAQLRAEGLLPPQLRRRRTASAVQPDSASRHEISEAAEGPLAEFIRSLPDEVMPGDS
jgi:Type II restriction endonuclease EcoO109I